MSERMKPLGEMKKRTSKRRNNELYGAVRRVSENLFVQRDYTTPHVLIEGKLCSIHFDSVRFVAVHNETIVAEFDMYPPHSIGHPQALIWTKFLQDLLDLARVGTLNVKGDHSWLFEQVEEALKEAK